MFFYRKYTLLIYSFILFYWEFVSEKKSIINFVTSINEKIWVKNTNKNHARKINKEHFKCTNLSACTFLLI